MLAKEGRAQIACKRFLERVAKLALPKLLIALLAAFA
jgi:hypothetical protein